MARINIEECWWSDPRRTRLAKIMGDPRLADALALSAWKTSQQFWIKDRAYVPLKVWTAIEDSDKLVEVGLAELREDGVYVSGSSLYHEWIVEQREANRAGGQKSAQRERDEKGRLLPKDSKSHPSPVQVNPSESKSPTPTLPLSLSHSLDVVKEEDSRISEVQKFDDRFNNNNENQIYEEILKAFGKSVHSSLKMHLVKIKQRFVEPGEFKEWAQGLHSSLTNKNLEKDYDKSRYVVGAIKREIGVSA